jgi:hypothetical protein
MILPPGRFRWPETNRAAAGQEDGWAKFWVGAPLPGFFVSAEVRILQDLVICDW